MMFFTVIALLEATVFVWLLDECVCFPNGQVAPSCGDMMPVHPPFTASTSSPPFSLSVSSDTYRPNGTITVTLEVLNSSFDFQGFLLQARSWKGSVLQWPVGRFSNNDSSNFTFLNCKNKENSTVSQASRARKKMIQLTWEAPSSTNNGDIFFSATLVHDYTTFWADVKSTSLMLDSSGNSGIGVFCTSPLLLITVLLSFSDP